ncbi:MAG: hypothetical protein J6A59_03930 [Lachnospiraceae bacterium]|nr:hypothetical protein [Lachnospiraceae bacterium]
MGELLDAVVEHDIPNKICIYILEIKGNEVIVIIDGKKKRIKLDTLIKLDRENKVTLDLISRERLKKAVYQRQITRAMQADNIINNSEPDDGYQFI